MAALENRNFNDEKCNWALSLFMLEGILETLVANTNLSLPSLDNLGVLSSYLCMEVDFNRNKYFVNRN